MTISLKYLQHALSNPKLMYIYIMRYHKLSKVLAVSKSEVRYYINESKYKVLHKRLSSPRPFSSPVLYALVRAVKPAKVVETGVFGGIFSAMILQALEFNTLGTLYSIDFPIEPLLEGKETGWLIPTDLRHRWRLIIGKSSEKLQPLLEELGSLDIFLHDSEHTYDNMTREFELAWSYLRPGGFLLSDDIRCNSAFSDFVKRNEPQFVATFNEFGVARKALR